MTDTNLIHFIAPGPIAGAEKVVLTGCRALLDKGVKLTLGVIHETRFPEIGEEFCEAAKALDIPTHDFYAEKPMDMNLKKQMEIFWESYGAGIIHAHGFKAITYCYLTKNKDQKLVVHQHGYTSHTLKVRFYEATEKFLLNRCDKVIPVSNEMAEDLKRSGVKPEKLCTIKNMMALKDLEKYPHSPKEDGGPIRLVFVGRLSREKGLDHLIKALAKVSNSYELTVLGRGPLEYELKDMVKTANLTKKVKFVGFQKNILPYLQKSDALVMPSLREGLPMTLLEAMAFGLPIIGTSVGALITLVTTNGLLCLPGNTERLEEILLAFAENFDKYRENAVEKADIVKKEYSAETWAEVTIQMYQSL